MRWSLGISNQSHFKLGLHILSQSTSLGAMHDSSERFPPPKCHPDTRHEVIRVVMQWIEDDYPDSSVFWIYGPAGAGKSAIAQTLAELIQASGRSYGGSFFFSRGKIGRDQAHHLFTTIAYQLAFHNTSFREHLNQILYENPALPTKPHQHSDASSHRRTTGEIEWLATFRSRYHH
jgi:ABC-type glutathione transport system ATPase component